MSDTETTSLLGGQHRRFNLDFNHALIFEREQRKSLYATMQEFLTGSWRLSDAIEIVRLGLVGGGMDEIEAFELADGMKLRPAAQAATLATAILEAAFFGKSTAAIEEADRVFGRDDGYGGFSA